MSDIATVWNPATSYGDWALDLPTSLVWVDQDGNAIRDQHGNPIDAIFTAGAGLVTSQDLYTAVIISLFTDAQASADDVIPDGSNDRRGWWGGAIGSKLWLRERCKATPTLPALIKSDIEEALQWLVDLGVIAAVDVSVAYLNGSTITAQVVLRRQDGTRLALQFSRLWENI